MCDKMFCSPSGVSMEINYYFFVCVGVGDIRTGVPGSGFVVSGTGSVSGVPIGGGMKTGFSGGGGGMLQSCDGVPHVAVASGGVMRTGMAVGGARRHSGDGVSTAKLDMDPEEFDGKCP